MAQSTSQSGYNISVNHDNSARYGYLLAPSAGQHRYVSQMTDCVIRAMTTRKAAGALLTISQNWFQHHRINHADPRSAVQSFQQLLLFGSAHRPEWPTIILHWVDHALAASFLRDTPASERSREFSMKNHYFRLNGHVSSPFLVEQLHLCAHTQPCC